MNKSLQAAFLILILIIACFLRFYKLETIPAGLHADAVSQAYNAFSLLNTGKDRYGQPLPILFRAFGYYQPPLYTYLTIIPISLFGNSPFSAHVVSALSGLILVVITYFFMLALFSEIKNKIILVLISALTIAIAPWSILFSRLAVEANLGLLLFVVSLTLYVYSLKKIQILPLASFILGLSTHAYYSERLIAVIFFPLFVLLFRRNLLRFKKWIILAFSLFVLTQLPHLMILNTGAFTQRFDQVSYFGHLPNNSFIVNYLTYYSPKHLFFDSDTNIGRTMPGLSVFYVWFLVPFLVGLWFLLKNRVSKYTKIIGLLLIITPLSASFTVDFFYPLRTLSFLWILTLVISLGLFQIYMFIKLNILKLFILGILFIYSIFSLYTSYFILFKYEKAINYGYAYIKLLDKLSAYNDKQVIIDSARDPGIGVRIAYLKRYPPELIQDQLSSQLKTPYYSSIINTDEIYKIDNIEVKPMNFGDACRSKVILVGDRLAISSKQIIEHGLKLEFEIPDLSGKVALLGYSTHPKITCPQQSLSSF